MHGLKPPTSIRRLARILAGPDDRLVARLTAPDFDWAPLLATANAALLTPALHAALVRHDLHARIPDEVGTYLAEIARRNVVRNRRLSAQATELVTAFNRAGITPLLCKGAAVLLVEGPEISRMVTDIDIQVPPSDLAGAVAVLARLGYRCSSTRTGRHAFGDFVRDRDPGAVDLHVELINPAYLLPAAAARGRAVAHRTDDAAFLILAPTDRVLHLLLHDMVHDYGIHKGRLDLRHLHEFSGLVGGSDIVWPELCKWLEPMRLTHALDVWLRAAADLFGIARPRDVPATRAGALHLQRMYAQLRYPWLGRAGEIAGRVHHSLAWYRLQDRQKGLPRLRRAVAYVRTHRTRTLQRLLHVLSDRRA